MKTLKDVQQIPKYILKVETLRDILIKSVKSWNVKHELGQLEPLTTPTPYTESGGWGANFVQQKLDALVTSQVNPYNSLDLPTIIWYNWGKSCFSWYVVCMNPQEVIFHVNKAKDHKHIKHTGNEMFSNTLGTISYRRTWTPTPLRTHQLFI